MEGQGYTTIDEYIGAFPEPVQVKLEELRRFIREIVPEAQEKISYQIPTFYLNGNLVHFAAHRKHIGFYPGASGIAGFKEELAGYKSAKGWRDTRALKDRSNFRSTSRCPGT
jgi:uncharacterized protein YdhG (YjbR/CyaY superfamily)